MTDLFNLPHTQNSARVLEFRCLYTSDLRRKQKRWQDGRLKYHTFNKRVMVYDERSNFVGDVHWREDYELCDGEELQLERGGILAQVQEKLETHTQDLTELVDKRRKEKEARAAARIANAPPASFPATTVQNLGTPASALKSKPFNSLLTPSGHHGRAQLPTESPFEERQRMNNGNQDSHENERLPKRRKPNESAQSRNGYAQNLTGTVLTLASSKPTSTSTIRYAAFKPKFAASEISTTIVDPSSDDEQENGLEKKISRQRVVVSRPDNPQKAKYRRSPSTKSGYASNLTGATLSLNCPTRTLILSNGTAMKKGAPVQPQKNFGSSPEVDARPPPGTDKNTRETALLKSIRKRLRKSPSPDRHSPPLDDQPLSSSPAARTAIKAGKTKDPAKGIAPSKNVQRSDFRSFGKNPTKANPPVGDPDANSSKSASLTKGTRRLAGENVTHLDSSSSEESMNTTPPVPEPKMRLKNNLCITKTDIVLRSNSGSGRKFSGRPSPAQDLVMAGKLNESFSSVFARSIGGNVSKAPVSSLRIKPRQPRKMMMLMDRPNSRKPPAIKPLVKSLTTVKDKTKAAEEPVLSQATRDLDLQIQRQQAQIQARLNKKRPLPDLSSDKSSQALVDSSDSHRKIDQLLTHNDKNSKSASPEQSTVQNPSKHPKDSSLAMLSSLIIANPGASSPKTSSPRLSPSRISPQSQNLSTAKNDANPQGEIAQIGSLPLIARLDVRNPSSSSQLNKSCTKESQCLSSSLAPAMIAQAAPINTKMSSHQVFPLPSPEKTGGSKDAEVSNSEILEPSDGDVPTTEHSQADGSSEVKQNSVTTEEKGLEEACITKHSGHKRGEDILKSLTLQTCSPPNHLTEELQMATEKLQAIVRPSPGSINRASEKPHINESAPVEQAIQDSYQVAEDQHQDLTSVQLACREDKPGSPPAVQEASGLKPGNGVGHWAVNDFNSKWQGSDSSINPEFALSIATINQPKFKLSKPIQRVNPVPPGRLWRAAGSADDQTNGPQDNSAVGMPVTTIGPWSREAFDLFGSWGPPGGYAPPT